MDDDDVSQLSPDGDFIQKHEEQEQENEDEQEDSVSNKKKKKALLQLRCQIEDSILGNNLVREKYRANEDLRDIKIWGVPLLPSLAHESTDVILMKFLKAKDYNVREAVEMLKNTIVWRHEFNTDEVLDEKFGPDLENMGYIDGTDNAGHPLCFQSYEVFKDKEIYRKRFASKESSDEFLRWRIKFMERCVHELDFKPGGRDSVLLIVDVKNISRPVLNEMIRGSKKYYSILQDYYPGILFKYVIVNVPIWFFAFYTLHRRMMTKKYKLKVIYVKPAAVTETLLKFIEPEHIPAHYGGLRWKGGEFSLEDKVLEQKLKGSATEQIQMPVTQAGMTIFWDVTVVGCEVSYKEEFVPDDECSYNVLLKKGMQIGKLAVNSFHVREPGKIVVTFVNPTSKNRKVFYRYKLELTS